MPSLIIDRSGTPIRWVVVRLIDDYNQVGGEREGERRLRSSCDLADRISLVWVVSNGWVDGG